MTFLLDVSILIALLDQEHPFHEASQAWFADDALESWATCPITENGVIRILGHPHYPGGPGSPAGAAKLLEGALSRKDHVFWADDLSLLASPTLNLAQITGPNQVTDTYLLLLATIRGGKLATLDRRFSPSAIAGGKAALQVIS